MANLKMARTIESIDSSTPLVEAALIYASRGWPVFPVAGVRFEKDDEDGITYPWCDCGWGKKCPAIAAGDPDADTAAAMAAQKKAQRFIGKHPMVGTGGFHWATTHASQIKAWWKKWPTANIAIRCGRESRLMVVDIDNYKGGAPSLLEIVHDLLGLKDFENIPMIKTGSGGKHLLFAHPMIESVSGALPEPFTSYVDMRADGTYILAPPSIHRSGKRYEWVTRVSGNAPLIQVKKLVTYYSEKALSSGVVRVTDNGYHNATNRQLNNCLDDAMQHYKKNGVESDGSARCVVLGYAINRFGFDYDDGMKVYERWAQIKPWPKGQTEQWIHKRWDQAAKRSPDERGRAVDGRIKINYRCAADVEEEENKWLWPGWIPEAETVLLGGMPGTNKSQLTCLLSSCITNGIAFPGRPEEEQREPQQVIFLNKEDSYERVQKRRLRLVNNNMHETFFIDSVTRNDGEGDKERSLNLQYDMEAVIALQQKLGNVGMIVWDPLDFYLGQGLKLDGRSDLMHAMAPLMDHSGRYGHVNLCICHMNKAEGMNVLHRLTGSAAFGTMVRVVHFMAKHPADKMKRLLLPVKLSDAMERDGLEFDVGNACLIYNDKTTDLTAEEVLGSQANSEEARKKKDQSPPAVQRAKRLIKQHIQAAPAGALLSIVLKEAVCGLEGVAVATYDRAAADLELVRSRRKDEVTGKMQVWCTLVDPENDKF